eukprot:Clim_evm12s151 gene=Clim_evmTU12s151
MQRSGRRSIKPNITRANRQRPVAAAAAAESDLHGPESTVKEEQKNDEAAGNNAPQSQVADSSRASTIANRGSSVKRAEQSETTSYDAQAMSVDEDTATAANESTVYDDEAERDQTEGSNVAKEKNSQQMDINERENGGEGEDDENDPIVAEIPVRFGATNPEGMQIYLLQFPGRPRPHRGDESDGFSKHEGQLLGSFRVRPKQQKVMLDSVAPAHTRTVDSRQAAQLRTFNKNQHQVHHAKTAVSSTSSRSRNSRSVKTLRRQVTSPDRGEMDTGDFDPKDADGDQELGAFRITHKSTDTVNSADLALAVLMPTDGQANDSDLPYELVLLPIDAVLQMRPSLPHLDAGTDRIGPPPAWMLQGTGSGENVAMDVDGGGAAGAGSNAPTSSTGFSSAAAAGYGGYGGRQRTNTMSSDMGDSVQVRFHRKETDRALAAQVRSFAYQDALEAQEPWQHLRVRATGPKGLERIVVRPPSGGAAASVTVPTDADGRPLSDADQRAQYASAVLGMIEDDFEDGDHHAGTDLRISGIGSVSGSVKEGALDLSSDTLGSGAPGTLPSSVASTPGRRRSKMSGAGASSGGLRETTMNRALDNLVREVLVKFGIATLADFQEKHTLPEGTTDRDLIRSLRQNAHFVGNRWVVTSEVLLGDAPEGTKHRLVRDYILAQMRDTQEGPVTKKTLMTSLKGLVSPQQLRDFLSLVARNFQGKGWMFKVGEDVGFIGEFPDEARKATAAFDRHVQAAMKYVTDNADKS